MIVLAVVGWGLGLAAAVVAGTVAHELAHAAVLRAFGVGVTVEWLPDDDRTRPFGASVLGGWARVSPRRVTAGLAPWKLRVAAVAPLALAVPFALTLLGVLPNALRIAGPVVSGAAVGWLACALPSPQDFSLFVHAERALARHARGTEDLERRGDNPPVSGGAPTGGNGDSGRP